MMSASTNNKRQILHVITGLDTGGAEMMLFKILSNMNRDHFSPAVLSLIHGGPVRERIEALGVPVYSLGMRRGIPSLTAFWHLIRLIRRLRPILIQGWMYHGNLVALLVSSFLPKPTPVLWNIRQSLYNLKNEKRMTAWVIRLCARLSSKPAQILYNSRVSASQHEALGYVSDKRMVIPNGFDIEVFSPSEEARLQVRQELGLSPTATLIGLIGRYHPMKDHANFIRAADRLSTSTPDVHFLLAGTNVDVENKELMDLIHNLKLTHKLHLLGERKDINRLTAALDIGTSSSSYGEGFPNVIGEAMACEVPCVVTDVGDSGWVVGDTGIVIRPQDPLAMASAWKKLLDMDLEERKVLGTNARKRVVANFSIHEIASQYDSLYRRHLTEV